MQKYQIRVHLAMGTLTCLRQRVVALGAAGGRLVADELLAPWYAAARRRAAAAALAAEAEQARKASERTHRQMYAYLRISHFQKSKPGPARVPTAASVGSASPTVLTSHLTHTHHLPN